MGVIAGHDGSPAWIVTRLGVIASVTTVALVATREPWRSMVRIVIGVGAIVVGIGIGVVYLLRAGDVALAVAGLAALGSGLVLVVSGVAGAVRGRRRWSQAAGVTGAVLAVAVACLTFVPAVMATNVPRPDLGSVTPASYGLRYQRAQTDERDLNDEFEHQQAAHDQHDDWSCTSTTGTVRSPRRTTERRPTRTATGLATSSSTDPTAPGPKPEEWRHQTSAARSRPAPQRQGTRTPRSWFVDAG